MSPCVLPLLPILIGSAIGQHRNGPLMLALGVGLSFTLAGVLLASIGLYLGFNQGWLRDVAAVVLVLFGAVLVSTWLQHRFATATTGLSRAGDSLVRRLSVNGLPGQFALGSILGLVWAPCVGPTLGAAITIASQGRALAQVALVMLIFGIGAALPLAVLGKVSRGTMLRMRANLNETGIFGKCVLGIVLIIFGGSILAGFDKGLEARLVQLSPDWLTELTTHY